MAENLNLDVVFRLAVQNAGDAARDLEGVANQANRLGQLSDQGLDQFNRGLARGSQEARNLESQLSTLRYANYDLSRTYLTIATAIAGVGAATVTAFASQESAFTEVERILATNGESVGSLRDDLMALSTEIPVSFSDLSAIAAIGAALDIASDDLAEFSEVVAQTAAVTGVSTEEVASGIARIAQYTDLDDTADGFEKISSAILAAGNISVATEPEVLRFAQAIALPGSNAGLAADEIIGFAAATASFARINVEGAGSAFARVFTNIERAVDEGGAKLNGFADIAGMSASQFQSAWDEGGAGGAFRAILQGLNQDLPNLNANLDELGIRNIRDRRVVSALAQQWDRVQGILTQTSGAFAENTTLSQAYSMVLDDLSSQFQIFLNALQNAAAAAGGTLAPALTDLLGVATELLVAFAGFAQSDFGKFLLNLLAPIAAISAGVAAFRGGIALATASFIGLRQALGPIGGIAKGVAGQIGMLGLVSGRAAAGIDRTSSSAESASRSTGRFSAAMGRMGRAAVANWDIVLSAAILAQAAIRQAMKGTEASTEELANAIRTDLGSALDVADNGTSPILNNFSALAAIFEQTEGRAFDLGDALRLVADSPIPDLRWSDVLSDIENLVSGTSRARDAIENVGDALSSMDASQAQQSARQMVEEFRLTEDQMWSIIEGSDQYRDALTRIIDSQGRTANRQELLAAAIGKGVYAMTDASNEAAVWEGSLERVAEDAAEAEDALNQLQEAILAITGQSADFSQAQEALSGAFNSARDAALGFQGSLFDTSDEAITFRSNLRDLDTSAREAALALVDTGASADEVQAKYREGRDALVDLISGFFNSREEAAKWADDVFGSAEEVEEKLGETAEAANGVPGEVHTDVTQEGAEEVQNEAKKTRDRLAEIQDERRTRIYEEGGATVRRSADETRNHISRIPDRHLTRIQEEGSHRVRDNANLTAGALRRIPHSTLSRIQESGGSHVRGVVDDVHGRLRQLNGYTARTYIENTTRNQVIWDYYQNNMGGTGRPPNAGQFASGGYTGRGAKYEPAGIVHRGEYVIPKQYVNQSTGLPYADALGKLVKGANPSGNYARGGFVQPMTQNGPIDLSASTIQKVAQAIRSDVYIDSERITRSVNAQNARRTERGAL